MQVFQESWCQQTLQTKLLHFVHLSYGTSQVNHKFISNQKRFSAGDQITRDLQKYLSTRFDKTSIDSDLQQTIRENLYNRTVPCK